MRNFHNIFLPVANSRKHVKQLKVVENSAKTQLWIEILQIEENALNITLCSRAVLDLNGNKNDKRYLL